MRVSFFFFGGGSVSMAQTTGDQRCLIKSPPARSTNAMFVCVSVCRLKRYAVGGGLSCRSIDRC